MSSFLEYVPGTSPLHRMNPVAKLAAAMPCSFIRFISSIVNVLRSFSTAIGAVRLFVSIVVSI